LDTPWQLSKAFSQLPWASEADLFLWEIVSDKLSLVDQLRARSISRIVPIRWPEKGFIGVHQPFFWIWINPNQSAKEQVLTLGHEIAHTFHLDSKADDPFHRFSHIVTQKNRNESVEFFCEEFAKKWVDLYSWSEQVEIANLLYRFVPLTFSHLTCHRQPP
jgi:hypothetical protein